jgi:hypothetical protein
MSTMYSFLPWVRQGAVTAIGTEDPLDGSLSPRPDLPLQLGLNTADKVDVRLRLHGPADVVGIDPRQVIRTEPPGGTNNFPPNYFPAIEFDRPDFPWLFTPARAESQQGRLRPWLCLVAVRKQEGVTLRPPTGGGLPVLAIAAPAVAAEELPDLSEAWSWVHTQVVHAQGADPGAVLAAEPAKNVSRLLCPRRLAPHATYFACLVPAFDVGRKAGLGLPLTDADFTALRPAWGSGADAPFEIQLPVYYHWTFNTGQEGDFESVARRLKPMELPADIGAQKLFVGDAGAPSLPDLGLFDFAGVFRPPAFDPPILPDPMNSDRRQWVDRMAAWLNHPDDAARGDTPDAIVTPPIYGRFQQALQRLPEADGWVRDLNLDARNRAAAGLGVLFVQWYQEALMASAWEQFGEIRKSQQLIRQGELAREIGKATLAKRFAPAAQRGDLLYQMTAPAHARVRLDAEQTVAGWSRAHQLPPPATTGTFRRLARPNGPVTRRMRTTGISMAGPVAIRHAVQDAETPQVLHPAVASLSTRAQELERQKTIWSDGGASDPDAAGRAGSAIDALAAYFQELGGRQEPPAAARAATIPSAAFKQKETLLQQLDPGSAVDRRLGNRLRLGGVLQRTFSGDGTQQHAAVTAYPEFPQPMVEAVRELMPELVFAGADKLPDDRVTALETNPQFIEAFMVGLNHEMARELLWRGFPTDLQGTCFKYFWGATADVNAGRTPDLPDLHAWDPLRRLGDNLAKGNVAGQLALVIRGELLRRFPDAIIYAVKATAEGGPGSEEKYPLQRGALLDDAVFLLFDLTEEEALAGDGYFFVFQQQPTAPRFGLDATSAVESPAAWNDLAWPHVVTTAGGYLQVTASAAAVASVDEPDGPVWGFNGAHMAEITLQRPLRMAIHARRLL